MSDNKIDFGKIIEYVDPVGQFKIDTQSLIRTADPYEHGQVVFSMYIYALAKVR